MDTNVKYKSSLFSFLFSDPDLLRELYCALDNVTLPAKVRSKEKIMLGKTIEVSFELRTR